MKYLIFGSELTIYRRIIHINKVDEVKAEITVCLTLFYVRVEIGKW